MRQVRTKGIILTRINYGEADRIITFLTPDQGKVTAIAKAVRKTKSKLAGGIELFSVSDIGYIIGKSEINTLISTRLIKYYADIVKDTERTAVGYDVIKIANKATEDKPEAGYFDLVEETFKALDDANVQPQVARLWFDMHLLKLSGHGPNLTTDNKGQKLSPDSKYDFHLDQMGFVQPEGRKGSFNADQIKFLRLGFAAQRPHLMQRVQNASKLTNSTKDLVQSMLANHVRV
jgi:DNA repair protein RecO (recombination protein O)